MLVFVYIFSVDIKIFCVYSKDNIQEIYDRQHFVNCGRSLSKVVSKSFKSSFLKHFEIWKIVPMIGKEDVLWNTGKLVPQFLWNVAYKGQHLVFWQTDYKKSKLPYKKDQYFIILQICWKSIKILWQFGCLWILPVLFRGRLGRTLKFLLSLSGLIRGNCGTDLNMNYIFYFTSSTDLSLCFLVLWNGSFLFLLRI